MNSAGSCFQNWDTSGIVAKTVFLKLAVLVAFDLAEVHVLDRVAVGVELTVIGPQMALGISTFAQRGQQLLAILFKAYRQK
jgi:hypothetical protein